MCADEKQRPFTAKDAKGADRVIADIARDRKAKELAANSCEGTG